VVPAPPANVKKQLTVRLSFVVTSDGSVSNIRLLKRTKSDFDDFAIGVVSKWKFEPATKDGKPVAVRLEAEVRFHR
jgi:TonB family protein